MNFTSTNINVQEVQPSPQLSLLAAVSPCVQTESVLGINVCATGDDVPGRVGSCFEYSAVCSPHASEGGIGSSNAVAESCGGSLFTSPVPCFPMCHTGSLEREASRRAVIEFGGIQDAAASGLRSSGRIRAQHNADDTQLERAMALAEKRDFVSGSSGGPCYILHFSLSSISLQCRSEKPIHHAGPVSSLTDTGLWHDVIMGIPCG